MKKLIAIMLVAMVPFFTLAQKKSKRDKDKEVELKFMTIHGISFAGGHGMTGDEMEMVMTDMGDPGSEEAYLLQKKITGGKLRISFDFGSVLNNSTKKLMSSAMSLHTMTDAVNFLAKEGWEFSGSNIVKDKNITYYYYYMKK